MGVLNRRDYETAIPQLEKKFSDLSKYITVSDGQVQIKIEDLYGKVATLTVTTEEIDARVEDAEDNIGDLEVTAQAITQALTTKVTIFTSQPAPPYEFGDLWDKGADGLYRCINSRSTGNYTASDWEEEDATAQDAQDAADAAQSTADGEVRTRTTMIRSISGGTLTCYVGGSKGVFVNANGSVDIVEVTWSGGNPTKGAAVASYGSDITIGPTTSGNIYISGDEFRFRRNGSTIGSIWTHLNSFEITAQGELDLVANKMKMVWSSGVDSYDADDNRLYFTTTGLSYKSYYPTDNRALFRVGFNGRLAPNGQIAYQSISVGVGTGGTNRGIYDHSEMATSDKGWIIYHDDSNVIVPRAGGVTSSNSANLHVSTGGTLTRYTSSSRRYKTDIESITAPDILPENLYKLGVRQFKYRAGYITSNNDRRQGVLVPGFIAEEVEAVYPIAVDYNEDALPEDWNFRYLIPPMLALIQEQNERIKELERKLA